MRHLGPEPVTTITDSNEKDSIEDEVRSGPAAANDSLHLPGDEFSISRTHNALKPSRELLEEL